MIGPGWLPRPFARLRKRTLAYTRVRRRSAVRAKNRDRSLERVHHEIVIFDRGPAEFPVATVVPRGAGSRVRATVVEIGGWFLARWAWFRPRTVPVLVAVLGAVLVIASAEYLSHAHGGSLPQRTPSAYSYIAAP